ncbi:hypothetical protein M0D69_43355 [Caballeronia sp. SEWSISQ10-4 2]|nr:hypothetical protein [Caballeronia sp. SEWSISQ10-4 2]MDN7184735.1 hypothetical protein [Caballeronia sp. SEWSISQ10-4 2]
MAPQCAPQAATQQLEWPCPHEPGVSIVPQRDGVWDEAQGWPAAPVTMMP